VPRNESELEAFLRQERLATIGTVDSNGKPHAVPVHFVYAEGKIYVHTDRASVKVRNLISTPFAAIAVYSKEEAVILRGPARIVVDETFLSITEQFIAKYQYELDEQGKDSFGISIRDHKTRCVIEVQPEKISFW
jgi:nitroimidazol reductase NimA-like FMN-containing flavoprotein (pyridoxamine 5'-phosphate oxidase superfamily)